MLKPTKLGVKPPKIAPRLIISAKPAQAQELDKPKRQSKKDKG